MLPEEESKLRNKNAVNICLKNTICDQVVAQVPTSRN